MIEPPCLAWRARCARGLSLLLQTPLPPGSHRCPINSRFAESHGRSLTPGLKRSGRRGLIDAALAVCSRGGVAVAWAPAVPVQTQRRGVVAQLPARRLQNRLGE